MSSVHLVLCFAEENRKIVAAVGKLLEKEGLSIELEGDIASNPDRLERKIALCRAGAGWVICRSDHLDRSDVHRLKRAFGDGGISTTNVLTTTVFPTRPDMMSNTVLMFARRLGFEPKAAVPPPPKKSVAPKSEPMRTLTVRRIPSAAPPPSPRPVTPLAAKPSPAPTPKRTSTVASGALSGPGAYVGPKPVEREALRSATLVARETPTPPPTPSSTPPANTPGAVRPITAEIPMAPRSGLLSSRMAKLGLGGVAALGLALASLAFFGSGEADDEPLATRSAPKPAKAEAKPKVEEPAPREAEATPVAGGTPTAPAPPAAEAAPPEAAPSPLAVLPPAPPAAPPPPPPPPPPEGEDLELEATELTPEQEHEAINVALRAQRLRALDILLFEPLPARKRMPYAAAVARCENKEVDGIRGFRPPTLGEIRSLSNGGVVPKDYYWTLTSADSLGQRHLVWNSKRGRIVVMHGGKKRARSLCVRARDGQSPNSADL